ncbi:Sideroflexin-1 [Phytophthora fragariae]|uniref:Sidoreflexin n=2 Tax=Phytophthora TaxID=4783 RepID=A0A6A4ERE1_9STRA|nr:Sideroflexin-1 [Phytophthora fragariae]KAE9047088.1 Sideroflexin-1 [Phytophthora rubi]KAE8950166.1 Sideroflexin-1 [Phytophthora fragariae]KAE9031363.1 Sideroflexin-1 [Phytophthora fragariae]KAE9140626.1 Sideroflexin-1 [Phytophthora fragariae]
MSSSKLVNLDAPRWDQSTYAGRAKHFLATTNPLNVLASDAELDAAKQLVEEYKAGLHPSLSEDEIWRAKQLVDSAFHPDTGEKNFLAGRMACQVPGNMVITGCMMTFYRSTPAVVFWQFMNQTFNSIVNYTNRNASTGVSQEQLLQAYAAASTASVATALGLNRWVSKRPKLSNGLVGRLVPLVAVAAANCVNIPLMRQRELLGGIEVETADGQKVGKSKRAAVEAVAQVVPSRVLMAAPAMFIPPVIMNKLEQRPTFRNNKIVNALTMVGLTGVCLSFSTPLCCALFPQRSTMAVSSLEPELQEAVRQRTFKQHSANADPITHVFYNKGL